MEKELIAACGMNCAECGDVICCHNGTCFNCSIERLKVRKKLYRWEDG
jgi:hypothetical protein